MSIVACSVELCTDAVFVKKRQLCRRHYNRMMYSGSTDIAQAASHCLRCKGEIARPSRSGPPPSYCSAECRRMAGYERFKDSGKYAEGLDMAKAARMVRALPSHICLQCGGSWTSSHRKSKFCSSACTNRYSDTHNPLRCSEPDCDRGVRAKGLCAMHWRRKARADGRESGPAWNEQRKAHYHKRRAQKRTTQVEDIRPVDVYERDVWLCGLCSKAVDPDVSWPDPLSASLDHIVPLSLGGSHTWENVQLAHLSCNVSKGNRVEV